MSKGVNYNYTVKQILFLKRNHKKYTRPELYKRWVKLYGDDLSLGGFAGACKRKGFSSKNSATCGRFIKNSKPWNTGTKGKGICKSNSGTFKKGNVPANTDKVGTEKIESKDEYIKVKVANPNSWRMKHHIKYEKFYGKIPKGSVVRFKDGDKRNFKKGNLILVSRKLSLILNQNEYNKVSSRYKKTVMLISKIQDKM